MIITYFDTHGVRWLFNVPCDRAETEELTGVLRGLRRYRLNVARLRKNQPQRAQDATPDISADVEAFILQSLADRYPAQDSEIKHGNMIMA